MFKKRKFWTNKHILKAVFDGELEIFLNSIGELQFIESGQAKCVSCSTVVGIDNLGLIIPNNENINYVCTNMMCLERNKRGEDE